MKPPYLPNCYQLFSQQSTWKPPISTHSGISTFESGKACTCSPSLPLKSHFSFLTYRKTSQFFCVSEKQLASGSFFSSLCFLLWDFNCRQHFSFFFHLLKSKIRVTCGFSLSLSCHEIYQQILLLRPSECVHSLNTLLQTPRFPSWPRPLSSVPWLL